MSGCVDMHKSLPRPRIFEDPMVDPMTRRGSIGAVPFHPPKADDALGLARALMVERAKRGEMTVGRKQRMPSPSDELQATSDRLSARTEALNARTAALRTSSERLRAAT